MDTNYETFSGYDTGADSWRDNCFRYGIDEAIIISNNYIDMMSHRKCPEDEHQFCREMFTAMHKAIADRAGPYKIIYPYGFDTANERDEVVDFHKNREFNIECAYAIDASINASCYEADHCNLDLAAMSVISRYSFERVSAVLAHQIQGQISDGRYTKANKQWVQGFNIQDDAHTFLHSHAILIDGFTTQTRKLCAELGVGE